MLKIDQVVTVRGQPVDFDAAVNLMDDDLREAIHDAFIEGTDQDFIDMYAAGHAAKFGEEFQAS